MNRVIGLDSLRFVLAFIVLLGHGVIPQFDESIINSNILFYYIDILMKLVQPSGVAAVMAFFIISGFVIHYPYTTGKSINVIEFYLRRIIRIALPAAIAFSLYYFTFNLYMVVIWSLICEIIYYLLYPLILRYKEKHMSKIFVCSFVLSYIVSLYYTVVSDSYNGDFHRSGFLLTWIVGLPIWLLGVILADKYKMVLEDKSNLSYRKLWMWRIATYLASSVCLLFRFHASIPYSYSMPIYSFLVYFWIKNEIKYYKDKRENKILEFGGLMSYSLYLVHAYIIFVVGYIAGVDTLVNSWPLCIIAVLASLGASWLFYICIEKPSHKLARSIK